MSVDAFHAIATVVCVVPVTRWLVGTDGGVVSLVGGQALVVTSNVDFAERLFAASAASTATVYVVPHVRPGTLELVPVGDATADAAEVHAVAGDADVVVGRRPRDGDVVWFVTVWVSPVGAVGACVSGQGAVAATTVAAAERFRAASAASTPNVYVVPQVRPDVT